MPPRYAYWTIIAGGLPTSFRAAAVEDLLPTLRRLKERHPDAEMRWFARGKLWSSPEAQRQASQAPSASRGRDWRPGGEHKDPREKFRAAKQARNLVRREQRFERKRDDQAASSSPNNELRRPSNPLRPAAANRTMSQRPNHSRSSGSDGSSGGSKARRSAGSPAEEPGRPWRGDPQALRRAPTRPSKRGRGR